MFCSVWEQFENSLVLWREGCPEWAHSPAAHGAFSMMQRDELVLVERFCNWAAMCYLDSYSKITCLVVFFFHYIHCWSLIPVSSFPGRPIPPTSSSSLLPSAQLPSSHNPPPVSCQMPLLDSNTSHQIMDTNPDEEFSPNSYLLRACSGPQQASSSGKKNCNHMEFVCDMFVLFLYFFAHVLASPQN